MKCQKCARTAVVHLTEVLPGDTHAGTSRRAVEFHLCLDHAVEAGLLTPGAQTVSTAPAAPATKAAHSIVPVKKKVQSIALAPQNVPAADLHACPVCGMSWSQFKSGGVMGCTHDYEMFQAKLLPLLKRAQEGATEHLGKVPARRQAAETDRRRAAVRLQRELQRAVADENYESAARLRDELKKLDPA